MTKKKKHRRCVIFEIHACIRSFGFQSYRPHLVLSLKAEHKRQRLDSCRTQKHCNIEWNTIVFTDESRFCLGHHDGRQRVRRRCGQRRNSVERYCRHYGLGRYMLQ
jgi:hypothetical protein